MTYPDIPLPSQLHSYVPPPECMDSSLLDPSELPPEKATKFVLKVAAEEDLSRVLLQSDTSFLSIPSIDLEEAEGTAFYGEIKKKLEMIAHKLHCSKSFYASGSEQLHNLERIIQKLEATIRGEQFDLSISLYDPLSASFISAPPSYGDAQPDERLQLLRTTRTFEEEKELGLEERYYPDECFLTFHPEEEEEKDEGGGRKADEALTQRAVEEFVRLIKRAERVCILSGAGVSTESNIPAYRSISAVNANNDNLWDNFNENDEHISRFLSSEQSRLRYWQRNKYFKEIIEKASPNPSHYLAKSLQQSGKLLKVITQNIDGLYQLADVSPENIIQVHGTCRVIKCLSCSKPYPLEEVYKRLDEEGVAPRCEDDQCGGLLKPATVSFGQPIEPEVLKDCKKAIEECDLLVVMGSSLVVKPVCDLPGIALVRKTPLVIMNYGDTKYDPFATVLFDRQKSGELSERIISLLSS